MAIKLNIVQRPTDIQAAISRGYLYKDIKLDLTSTYLKGNEMYSKRETKDLAYITDRDLRNNEQRTNFLNSISTF